MYVVFCHLTYDGNRFRHTRSFTAILLAIKTEVWAESYTKESNGKVIVPDNTKSDQNPRSPCVKKKTKKTGPLASNQRHAKALISLFAEC